MTRLMLLAAVTCATMAAAVEVEKSSAPHSFEDKVCPIGEALTWTVQCDPGGRTGGERIWNPISPGAEVCRVSRERCEPVHNLKPWARPGYEVLDSGPNAGSLSLVTFGVGGLLGIEP